MTKNFKELERLLNKVAPAELPVVNLIDIISEAGPRMVRNLFLTHNFADASIDDVFSKVADKRNNVKDFVNSFREELHKLTWNVTEEEMLALQNSGKKYTPEDVIYVNLNKKQLDHLPAIVWLETGHYDEVKKRLHSRFDTYAFYWRQRKRPFD
ncbi:MAG: hypothetical protein MJZ34_14430 [Paludibacteraceae bacterium]|nr:hypothetical protein [Paludibacteraceae bacterium]